MDFYSQSALRRKGELSVDLLKICCMRRSRVLQGLPPSTAKKPDVCAGCGMLISEGMVILAMDATWHTACFK